VIESVLKITIIIVTTIQLMVQEETYNHAEIIKPAKKYLKAKTTVYTRPRNTFYYP
jgi:hypothetical protein